MAKIKGSYECALLLTNDLTGGKWKLRILWHIINGDNRFSLLTKGIPDITQKMLTTQLRELEESGLVIREDFKVSPPKVEYSINQEYAELIPIIERLCLFARKYANKNNINIVEDQ